MPARAGSSWASTLTAMQTSCSGRQEENVRALRRIGLVMRHRKLGFTANSMCVWKCGEDAIEAAGRKMAAHPSVTHCYQRPCYDVFPYNLYAMIHAGEPEAAKAIFAQLGESTGLSDGRMMVSLKEFKKASPVFFSEDDA